MASFSPLVKLFIVVRSLASDHVFRAQHLQNASVGHLKFNWLWIQISQINQSFNEVSYELSHFCHQIIDLSTETEDWN